MDTVTKSPFVLGASAASAAAAPALLHSTAAAVLSRQSFRRPSGVHPQPHSHHVHTQLSAARDTDGNSLLIIAAQQGDVAAAQQLLLAGVAPNDSNFVGDSALHWSATICNSAITLLLLRAGAVPNSHNSRNETPLHSVTIAAANAGCSNHVPIVNTVALLLHFGAHADVADMEGDTPLHWACRSDGELGARLAKLLLQAGCSVDVPNNDGETPLHSACSFGNKQAAELLLEAGANPNAEDHCGDTACDNAMTAGYFEVQQVLSSRGGVCRHQPSPSDIVTAKDAFQSFAPMRSALNDDVPEKKPVFFPSNREADFFTTMNC